MSPSVVGAANAMCAVPLASVRAVPIVTTPTDSVTVVPAIGPLPSRRRTKAFTNCPGRTFALSRLTTSVGPPTGAGSRTTTVSFVVVSLPALSRATTVIGSAPGVAVNDSEKAPWGFGTTVRSLITSEEPASVAPSTTIVGPSTDSPVVGRAMVSVGGVRSTVTVYVDAATTSWSERSVTMIWFAPSRSTSGAAKRPV